MHSRAMMDSFWPVSACTTMSSCENHDAPVFSSASLSTRTRDRIYAPRSNEHYLTYCLSGDTAAPNVILRADRNRLYLLHSQRLEACPHFGVDGLGSRGGLKSLGSMASSWHTCAAF